MFKFVCEGLNVAASPNCFGFLSDHDVYSHIRFLSAGLNNAWYKARLVF